MAKEHKFIGSGKEKSFPNGGTVINCSLCLDDVLDMDAVKNAGLELEDLLLIPVNSVDISKSNGKVYLCFTVSERRTESQWGDTHSVYIEEYYMTRGPLNPNRRTKQKEEPAPAPSAQNDPFDEFEDDIPF